MNRRWPIDPAETEAVIHAVCAYLRADTIVECRRCPALDVNPRGTPVKRVCRSVAEQVVNIVRHGDPFCRNGAAK